jgi:hypothetical protein
MTAELRYDLVVNVPPSFRSRTPASEWAEVFAALVDNGHAEAFTPSWSRRPLAVVPLCLAGPQHESRCAR